MSDSFKIAPHPCCVPSKRRLDQLEMSRSLSGERQHVTSGSTEGMVKLDGGRFLMGTESDEAFPADGEGPVREVTAGGFWMDARHVPTWEQRYIDNEVAYRLASLRGADQSFRRIKDRARQAGAFLRSIGYDLTVADQTIRSEVERGRKG